MPKKWPRIIIKNFNQLIYKDALGYLRCLFYSYSNIFLRRTNDHALKVELNYIVSNAQNVAYFIRDLDINLEVALCGVWARFPANT